MQTSSYTFLHFFCIQIAGKPNLIYDVGVVIDEEEPDFNLWSLLRDEIHQRDNVHLLHKVTCTVTSIKSCLEEMKTTARGYLYYLYYILVNNMLLCNTI